MLPAVLASDDGGVAGSHSPSCFFILAAFELETIKPAANIRSTRRPTRLLDWDSFNPVIPIPPSEFPISKPPLPWPSLRRRYGPVLPTVASSLRTSLSWQGRNPYAGPIMGGDVHDRRILSFIFPTNDNTVLPLPTVHQTLTRSAGVRCGFAASSVSTKGRDLRGDQVGTRQRCSAAWGAGSFWRRPMCGGEDRKTKT